MNIAMKKALILLALLSIGGALHAQTARQYIEQADSAVAARQITRALELFTKAIELEPNNLEAVYKRGICRNGTGDMIGAAEDMTVLIRLRPNDPEPYTNRAYCYAVLKRDSLGALDAARAVELDPKDTTAYYLLGNLQLRLNRMQEAVSAFHKYLELAPDAPQAKSVLDGLKSAGFAPVGKERKQVGPKDGAFSLPVPKEWNVQINDEKGTAQLYVASGAIEGKTNPRITGVSIVAYHNRDLAKAFPGFQPGRDSILPLLRNAAYNFAGLSPEQRKGIIEHPFKFGDYNGVTFETGVELKGIPWRTVVTAYLVAKNNSSFALITRVPAKLVPVYSPIIEAAVAGVTLK